MLTSFHTSSKTNLSFHENSHKNLVAPSPHIQRLRLTNFRNHPELTIDIFNNFVILFGANGAGKTSILEAISLLNVGRGLQNASPKHLQYQGSTVASFHSQKPHLQKPWSVWTQCCRDKDQQKAYQEQPLQIGTEIIQTKRRIHLNGRTIKHHDVAHHFNAFWLTSEMEHLLRASPHEKRRFLDQIIGRFDPQHPKRVARFEALQRQYNLLCLSTHTNTDKLWQQTVQEQLMQATIGLSSSRMGFVGRFNRLANSFENALPSPLLDVVGPIAWQISHNSIAEVENFCLQQLHEAIKTKKNPTLHDNLTIASSLSPEKDAAQFSAGERKSLIIAVILTVARLWRADKGFAPLLLLDDISGHLDAQKRHALWQDLEAIGCQTWATAQEIEPFSDIQSHAEFFRVSPGKAQPA